MDYGKRNIIVSIMWIIHTSVSSIKSYKGCFLSFASRNSLYFLMCSSWRYSWHSQHHKNMQYKHLQTVKTVLPCVCCFTIHLLILRCIGLLIAAVVIQQNPLKKLLLGKVDVARASYNHTVDFRTAARIILKHLLAQLLNV